MKTIITPKGRKVRDISGLKFGTLTVLSYNKSEYSLGPNSMNVKHYWNCKCECGEECVKYNNTLMVNATCPRCYVRKSKGGVHPNQIYPRSL